jgi:hypothetical protein
VKERVMLAKAIFAIAAAVLAGLAAFAPPEAAARAGRSVVSAGTMIAPIRIEAPRRLRNKALAEAQCKLDTHLNSSHYCGKW